jgi:hypothetical protein
VLYTSDWYPEDIALADLNGDGNVDLVSGSYLGRVSVLLGNGDGTFVAGPTLTTGTSVARVVVADFNGDGRPDLAISQTNNSVAIYLGGGDGSFSFASFVAAQGPFGIAAADLNGDGKLDLVVTNGTSGIFVGTTVTVFLGNGNGTFQSPRVYQTGTNPLAVAIADFNGDGKPDLIVVNADDNNVSVLLGNGDGTFGARGSFATGYRPASVSVGDFNRDGHLDLAIVNSFDVSILLGHGDGTFAAAVHYAAGNYPERISTGDFDGDGIVDIAATDVFDNLIAILKGNGDGSFQPPLTFSVGSHPIALVSGDWNGDRKTDLAVANYLSNNISVLLNAATGNSTVTVTANPGIPQSAAIDTSYAVPLSVIVRGAGSTPFPGAAVTFSAPASGPSGTFQGGTNSVHGTTDALGIATAPRFTANGIPGSFAVIAGSSGANASFALTNTATTQAPLFTSAPPPNGTYGASYAFTLTASGSPAPAFAVGTGSLPPGSTLNGLTGVISGTPLVAGSFTGSLTATNGVAPAATQGFAITIAPLGQTISFAPLGDLALGTMPFVLSATASSGLPVAFSSQTLSVCAVNASNAAFTATILAVGTCTIRAAQAGDSAHSPAPNIDRSFTVTAASQTINFRPIIDSVSPSLLFGNPPFEIYATASSGLPVRFASLTPATCRLYRSFIVNLTIGTCTIRASQGGSANYGAAPDVEQSVPITAGIEYLTFWPIGDHSWTDPPIQLSASSPSGLPFTFSSLTPSVCRVDGSIATPLTGGTCTVRATRAGSAEFQPATADQSFVIFTLTHPDPPAPFLGPLVVYSTYPGGYTAFDVLVGPDGSAYVGGSVASTDSPGLSSATFTNGGLDLLYVAKLDATDGSLGWATAVGGRAADITNSGLFAYVGAVLPGASMISGGGQVEAMARDAAGNVYVAAYANSVDFPVRGGTYLRNGARHLFAITPSGTVQTLGTAIDPAVSTVRALAVDAGGSLYLTGVAGPGLITSPNAVIPSVPAATRTAPYLIKLAPGGTNTVFATYLSVPGSRAGTPTVQSHIDAVTTAYALAVDSTGNTYLAGQATADDFPVTPGAAGDQRWSQDTQFRDAFVAKVNPGGTAFLFVARLDGASPGPANDAERATSIALSPDGGIVIGGKSATYPFYGSGSAFQHQVQFLQGATLADREIGFVAKLLADGSDWQFVAPIGASGGALLAGESILGGEDITDTQPVKVAVDGSGAIYAIGTTSSNRSLPVTSNLSGVPPSGAFIMKLSADGSHQNYSTTLGGGRVASGLALDGFGNAYVTGYGGPFVAKVNDRVAPLTLTSDANPGNAGRVINLTARLADSRFTGTIEFRDAAQVLGTVPLSNGSATLPTTFTAGVHRLSALYHGSGPFDGSMAPDLIQVVNQGP